MLEDREAEIRNPSVSGRIEEDVSRLDIPVDHVAQVRFRESLGHLLTESGRPFRGYPFIANEIGQRTPVDVLEHDCQLVVQLENVKNRHDARDVQPRDAAGLGDGVYLGLPRSMFVTPRHFDGDKPFQREIIRKPNNSISALTQDTNQSIALLEFRRKSRERLCFACRGNCRGRLNVWRRGYGLAWNGR